MVSVNASTEKLYTYGVDNGYGDDDDDESMMMTIMMITMVVITIAIIKVITIIKK